MALVLQEIPLPDGIETPDASQYGIVEISPDLEEARGLVHELVARLRAPDLHGSAR
jgi:hypothetical protein